MNSIQYNMLENAVNQLYKDEKIIKRLVYYINRLAFARKPARACSADG